AFAFVVGEGRERDFAARERVAQSSQRSFVFDFAARRRRSRGRGFDRRFGLVDRRRLAWATAGFGFRVVGVARVDGLPRDRPGRFGREFCGVHFLFAADAGGHFDVVRPEQRIGRASCGGGG